MRKNLLGIKFGRWVVLYKSVNENNKRRMWFCKCKCGKEKDVSEHNLIKKVSKSCGCLKIEQLIKRSTFHGFRHNKFYYIWMSLNQRCKNKKNKAYKSYGGRGIRVIWKNFEEFKKDMYKKYLIHKKNNSYTSLDRIDNNGNYCKENCRWADAFIQANNTRRNICVKQ